MQPGRASTCLFGRRDADQRRRLHHPDRLRDRTLETWRAYPRSIPLRRSPFAGRSGTSAQSSASPVTDLGPFIMTFHSAQVHLAVSRLLSAQGCCDCVRDVDCTTIDLNGTVAYRITVSRGEGRALARVLDQALGRDASPSLSDAPLGLDDARKLLQSAFG